jgi:hypothetical protein
VSSRGNREESGKQRRAENDGGDTKRVESSGRGLLRALGEQGRAGESGGDGRESVCTGKE